MAKNQPPIPKKNTYLDAETSELIADLMFDEEEEDSNDIVKLAPRYRAVLLEYQGGVRPVTQEQCDQFLGLVAAGMSQIRACEIVGADTKTFYRLRKSNEVFALAFEEALACRDMVIIEQSIEQATEGVINPNGALTFPSNPQLQMHVKAADPDRYRDRSEVIQRQGEDVKPIRQPGDRERLLKLLHKYGKKDESDGDVSDLL